MIDISIDKEKMSLKISGNLIELLTDTRHIVEGLVGTLLECSKGEAQFPAMCCIQSIFSDAVTFGLSQLMTDKDENTDSSQMSPVDVSAIRVDLQALRDWLNQKDTEEDEDEI